ncbi:YdeI/OmpD-associated family protein [Micrococcaceae bacterium Sec5.7]
MRRPWAGHRAEPHRCEAAGPEARAFYAALNRTAPRRHVEPIGEAETEEAGSRRIAKVVQDLKAGRK